MMIFAYALYVPAGIALTSACASQLLADSLHVTIGGGVLSVVILAYVAGVADLGIGTSTRLLSCGRHRRRTASSLTSPMR
jgi:hypothetical protein